MAPAHPTSSDRRLAVIVLACVVLPTYGGEMLSQWFSGSEARWHYILSGASSACLSAVCFGRYRHWLMAGACSLGVYEFGLKAWCGLMRVHQPIFAPNGYVCGDAGPALSVVGLFVSVLLAWAYHAATSRRF